MTAYIILNAYNIKFAHIMSNMGNIDQGKTRTYLEFHIFGGQVKIFQVRIPLCVGVRVLASREIGASDRNSPNVVLDTIVGEIRPKHTYKYTIIK